MISAPDFLESKQKDPEAMQIFLARELGRIMSENCSNAEDASREESSDGSARVEIVYPGNAWESEGEEP